MERKPFGIGSWVTVIERGTIIDKAEIIEESSDQVLLKSLHAFPGGTIKFGYEEDAAAWRVLFEGAPGQNDHRPRGPLFVLHATQHSL